ncbi:STIP1 homology and U-box containing protein 1 [Monoraphidium neglectum]|uniref:E3 ubiquitin-protein ligase CHIP n=1 Tax=Monoraphidium neglectum TaxID=145388 RepID=A0A0D2K5U0_9CHLO|nr:STIP1 homology and U-box containing protein 1 [Monoraphidium neglectum]KIZ05713.1 STIP1 homology and U-box containing protein 1 [Monoraphidium neglectum]|eukprot:XP_013904732.1 STIP1 homology and U-box containing protein 1 [Monoraphidium neglectum]
MGVTAGEKRAAEELRKEGNALFQRGKYAAASERYTEAITLDPQSASLYVNRALCAKKQAAPGAWERILEDAERALAREPNHMKANYLCGMALRELGGDLGRAIRLLERALERAREQDDAIKDEIWRELAKANDACWREESARRRSEAEALRSQLRKLAAVAAAVSSTGGLSQQESSGSEDRDGAGASSGAQAGGGGTDMSARKAEGSSSAGAQEPGSAAAGVAGSAGAAEVNWVALDRVFERAARADTRGEVPSAFTCPLTMEVFRDPVVSKSGHTYERAALTEHIAKVGGWDPITRIPMTLADVRPNISMRTAVSVYLEEHGWAWHECY